MKYFKLLTASEFIGIATSSNFVRENPVNGWLLTSNENLGQFISLENKLYRDYWMQPIPNNTREYFTVLIQEINKEEYDILRESIHNNEPVIIDDDDDDDEPEPPVVVPDEPDMLVEYVREAKIKEMSTACRNTIEAGFDIELRGETYHFSLTTQDQLNLMSLSVLAQTQTLIPYHADGEECTFYTSDEINTLVQKMNELKIYNTAYYNALKEYINSLETIEEIGAITYGTLIPDQYKSDVLQVLE